MLELLLTLTVSPFCCLCLYKPSLRCNFTYEVSSLRVISIFRYFNGSRPVAVIAHFIYSLNNWPLLPSLLSPSIALDASARSFPSVKAFGESVVEAVCRNISFPANVNQTELYYKAFQLYSKVFSITFRTLKKKQTRRSQT